MPGKTLFSVESLQDSKDYLVTRSGWREDAVGRMSPALANVVATVKENGLEGVSVPIVTSLRGTSQLLGEQITASSPHWAQYIQSLQAEHDERMQGLIGLLNRDNVKVERPLRLAGAVSFKSTVETLEKVMHGDVAPIDLAELDSPGQLELNVGRVTVAAPPVAPPGYFGDGQVIAVIDGSVDINHPSLRGRVIRKGNFSEGGWDDYDLAGQLGRDHATAVAGIAAGDGLGSAGATAYVGIAPKATIWNYLIVPLKGNGSAVAAALEQACFDGARIANLSWGQRKADSDGTSVWTRTAEAAFGLGMLLVKSVGNTGPDAGTITVPADGANVLSVGAMDPHGAHVHDGSSRGPTRDGRSKPDVVAPGGGMTAPTSGNKFSEVATPGTSFASPVVAGLAAVLRGKHPGASAAGLRQAILSTCTAVAGADANVAGAGCVNVGRALTVPIA